MDPYGDLSQNCRCGTQIYLAYHRELCVPVHEQQERPTRLYLAPNSFSCIYRDIQFKTQALQEVLLT